MKPMLTIKVATKMARCFQRHLENDADFCSIRILRYTPYNDAKGVSFTCESSSIKSLSAASAFASGLNAALEELAIRQKDDPRTFGGSYASGGRALD